MDTQQLIKACKKGKLSAQKELYDTYARQMMGLCYRYTRSQADAEDVLQDGFMKVFSQLERYRGEGDLGAWIRRIMVNTCLNYLKKNRSYNSQLYYTEDFLHPIAQEDVDVDLNAKEIVSLIRQLPPGYQLIFNLVAIEGYSHVEVGEMLGIKDATSRSQFARARGLLMTWVEDYSKEQKKDTYAR